MRLGKTMVAIRYLRNIDAKRVLVVAPVEGLWAWQRELSLEGIGSIGILKGSKAQRLEILKDTYQWFLVNYESLLATPEILEQEWDAIICDESRRIANPKAKITRLLNAAPRTNKRLVLSGEPAPESPLEYFEQFKFLNGSFMGCQNYWQFRNGFFRELGPHDWVPQSNKLDRLKGAIHGNAFFMSRKEAGIPDRKIYEVRAVPLPPDLRKAYDSVRRDFMASLNGTSYSTKWVPVQYMWLHQISCGFLGEKMVWEGKIKSLVDLLRGELRNEPVVVWFRFNAALRVANHALESKGVTCFTITGETPKEERFRRINQFREGRFRVLLIQIKCGKTAIDLSNSSTAVYFSNSYSLEDRHQSEDRILNPLKRDPLLYVDLIGENTVEEDILEVLRQKGGESKFFMNKLIQRMQRVNA